MESQGLCLWRVIRDGGSSGGSVIDCRSGGACVVEATSDNLASCSNMARTLGRSLLGMGGNTASVVRVNLAS